MSNAYKSEVEILTTVAFRSFSLHDTLCSSRPHITSVAIDSFPITIASVANKTKSCVIAAECSVIRSNKRLREQQRHAVTLGHALAQVAQQPSPYITDTRTL